MNGHKQTEVVTLNASEALADEQLPFKQQKRDRYPTGALQDL